MHLNKICASALAPVLKERSVSTNNNVLDASE